MLSIIGDIPDLLKTAFVIPVHKGGSRALPVNFRPVSLTSHFPGQILGTKHEDEP